MGILNLANVNHLLSKSAIVLANSSSVGGILSNPLFSNNLIKINSLLAFNSNTANTGSLVVSFFDYTSNIVANIFSLSIAPQANTVTLIDRTNEMVLEEGDSLRVFSNISNTISVVASYDVIRETSGVPIEYLVVAGGAAGGVGPGGGGGAGGLLYGFTTFSYNLCHSIVIGGGGSVINAASVSGCGSNSFICTAPSGNVFLAIGGGGGGGNNTIPGHDACPGGSGGGSGIYGTCASGTGVTGQGFPGGLMNTPGGPWPATGSGGGGGGGASQAGESPPTSTSPGGYGGNGCCINITGVTTFYAGGGGGGGVGTASPARPGGAGGSGGGGPGGATNANGTNGTTNTGGGGGGGNNNSSTGASCSGGAGGSGIILLRHPTDYRTANTTGNVTVTSNVGYTIYQFNGSGSICFV